jgi:hypothetical protein
MVGQFNRNNLLLKAKNNKYYRKAYDNSLRLGGADDELVDGVVKTLPKIVYNSSVLELSPQYKPVVIETNHENKGSQATQTIDAISGAKTGVSVGAAVVNKGAKIASKAVSALANGAATLSNVENVANIATTATNALNTAAEVADTVGDVASGVGVVVSGAGLASNIVDAVNEHNQTGHVSFDTSMRIADNATGIVSGVASMIPVVGTGISIALTAGEKLVTGIIKIVRAEKEAKKKNHGKNLGFFEGAQVALDAVTPHWMNTDFSELKKEHDDKKKAEKEAKRQEEKQKNKKYNRLEKLRPTHKDYVG